MAVKIRYLVMLVLQVALPGTQGIPGGLLIAFIILNPGVIDGSQKIRPPSSWATCLLLAHGAWAAAIRHLSGKVVARHYRPPNGQEETGEGALS